MNAALRRRSGQAWLLERGYHAVYRPDEANRCPGCGRSHWIVGRATAECAFCATALPIAQPAGR